MIRLAPRTMYICGLAIFAFGSLFCGLAKTSAIMIIFRIVQGIGAGILLPNAMAIVAETFGPQERGQALGIWSAMVAVGSAMGPTIGGYLIETLGWRSIFFSIIPLSIVSIGLAYFIVPKAQRKFKSSADFLGAALLVTSTSLFLVALNQGQREGWDSLYIVSLFYFTLISFTLFVLTELRVAQPLIEFGLFRNVNFTIATTVGLIAFGAFWGSALLLPFFLKSVLDYSSISAGLMLLPQTVAILICSPIGGWLSDRFGSRLPAFLGLMMMAAALYSFNTISPDYSTYDFAARLVLFGAGLWVYQFSANQLCCFSLAKGQNRTWFRDIQLKYNEWQQHRDDLHRDTINQARNISYSGFGRVPKHCYPSPPGVYKPIAAIVGRQRHG